MTEEILKITKIVFDLYSWPYYAPIFIRLLGLDFIGTTPLFLLSYRETEYGKVKNVVIFAIIHSIINSIGFIVLQFIFELPLINWSNIAFYILFAVLYCYIYVQQQK